MSENEIYTERPTNQGRVVYSASDSSLQAIRDKRDHVHQIGNQYANHHVRVQTIDGITYEGRIHHTDGAHLHLIVPGPPVHGGHYHPWHGQQQHYHQQQGHGHGHYPVYRSLYGGSQYNDVILPLVLYELLVISLL
jgi:ABC-type nickel/cobalt efflux system permease component RcnA